MRLFCIAILTVVYAILGAILEQANTIESPAYWSLYGYLFAVLLFTLNKLLDEMFSKSTATNEGKT